MHADGFTIVPHDMLPADLRERFDMGDSGLADSLEDAERNLFSPKK
jgi:hypothetical protein